MLDFDCFEGLDLRLQENQTGNRGQNHALKTSSSLQTKNSNN